jgi:hypothetical protein
VRQVIALGLFSTLLLVQPAFGQLHVLDELNLFQNTISATEAVVNTTKWVLEQLGLPAFVLAEGAFAEDLATLERLVHEGQAVGMDVTSLQAQLALFALEAAPMTSTGYAEHIGEIRFVVNQAYGYAMRTQTLIRTILGTIRHVTVLLGDVMSVVGGVQAKQAIAQYEAQLVQIQSELKLQTSAFQRAQTAERLTGPFIEQSSINLSNAAWEGWAEGDVGL